MERVFDSQLEKIKTKLIKICSLIDEQFELIHESLKEYDTHKIDKVFIKNEEIKSLKASVERNCQKIFVLTQPLANDLRDVLLYLKINLLFDKFSDSIIVLTQIIDKHSLFKIDFDIQEIYDSSYSTQELIKSSFDAFIVNDLELAYRINASHNSFDEMINNNIVHLTDVIREDPGRIEAVLNVHTFLNELKNIYKFSAELCEDIIVINKKKEKSLD